MAFRLLYPWYRCISIFSIVYPTYKLRHQTSHMKKMLMRSPWKTLKYAILNTQVEPWIHRPLEDTHWPKLRLPPALGRPEERRLSAKSAILMAPIFSLFYASLTNVSDTYSLLVSSEYNVISGLVFLNKKLLLWVKTVWKTDELPTDRSLDIGGHQMRGIFHLFLCLYLFSEKKDLNSLSSLWLAFFDFEIIQWQTIFSLS